MATKKTAFVDVNFVITVRVPVDMSDLPTGVGEGDDISELLPDDTLDDIVTEAIDTMDGPGGENVESIVVCSIDSDDDDTDNDPDEDAVYNSPEYIHDIALDWLYDHEDEIQDLSDDEIKDAVIDYLRQEGYDVDDVEADMAIDDAIADYQ